MKKIIIMDDENERIQPLLFRMEMEGYNRDEQIIYCPQIDEAFAAMKNQNENIGVLSLDLLIGDNLRMLSGDSKINGLKALAKMRELYPALPIVCYSILKENEGGIREALEKYNAHFINKSDGDAMECMIEFFKKHVCTKNIITS